MKTCLKIQLLAIILAGTPGAILHAQVFPQCAAIPADDPDPPALVCEFPDRYLFQIAGEQHVFDKHEWRTRARRLISDYSEAAGIPASAMASAQVTFWLSVPESSPADAYGRAIVTAGKYKFVVNLPIRLDTARISSHDVADLDGKEYPQYLGHRVGSILVKKAANSSAEDFARMLKENGATGTGETAGGWTSVFTRDFDEVNVMMNVTSDPRGKQHVAGANLNAIFEWIAWREPVFVFSLGENPVHTEPVTQTIDGY